VRRSGGRRHGAHPGHDARQYATSVYDSVAAARQSEARGLAPLALARLLLAGLLCHARPVYPSTCDHCRYQAIPRVSSAGTASSVWGTQVPLWFSLPGDWQSGVLTLIEQDSQACTGSMGLSQSRRRGGGWAASPGAMSPVRPILASPAWHTTKEAAPRHEVRPHHSDQLTRFTSTAGCPHHRRQCWAGMLHRSRLGLGPQACQVYRPSDYRAIPVSRSLN